MLVGRQSINDNNRSKGVMHAQGKIIKGCIKDATTKTSIGSIPTSYQSIIYKNTSTKAFGKAQRRFCPDQPNFVGYNDSATSFSPEYKSPGAGSGSFNSKVQKLYTRDTKTPGPGTYQLQRNNKVIKRNRKCMTQNKQRQNSVKLTQSTKRIVQNKIQILSPPSLREPGPGYYEKENINEWKDNISKGWKSSFVSRLDRNSYIPQSITPGPGFYKRQLHKTKEQKDLYKQLEKEISKQKSKVWKYVRRLMKKDVSASELPGPCTYDSKVPQYRPFYDKIKASRNFIAARKDRFGNQYLANYDERQQTDTTPSPFSYNLKSKFDQLAQLKLIQSSSFMSESQRGLFEGIQNRKGPNDRIVEAVQNKNFRFNIKNQWI